MFLKILLNHLKNSAMHRQLNGIYMSMSFHSHGGLRILKKKLFYRRAWSMR